MRNHTTKLERARRYLLFVTIVLCIQFVILAALLHAKMGALTTRGQVVLIVGAMIVLGFGGLWLWSKRNPVAAILVALIAYITLWGVQIAINPVSILSGIILKILAIGALVGGLRAGLAARAEEARQAKAEGSRTTAPEAAASH